MKRSSRIHACSEESESNTEFLSRSYERRSVTLTTGLALRRLLTLAALALDGIILYFLIMQHHRKLAKIEISSLFYQIFASFESDQVFCPIINNTHGEQRGHYCTVSGKVLHTELYLEFSIRHWNTIIYLQNLHQLHIRVPSRRQLELFQRLVRN